MNIISRFFYWTKHLAHAIIGLTDRESVLDTPTPFPLQKDFTMLSSFETNKTEAKIQGLSVQVGELFADLWKQGSYESDHALEAYKSLRRLLPTESFSDRHVGATAAHKATQGAS
jgi:hypothetical protein